MALTEIYVDPSIAADSGAGTIGDPYGDLEYAIEQENWPGTPTRVNIKAGTDEVLAADLETALADTTSSTAWNVTEATPLYFQGYSAAAGDLDGTATRAGISGGGGNFSILTATGNRRYVFFKDLRLHNTGTAYVLDLNNWSGVFDCEIDNSTGGGVRGDVSCQFSRNYVHNIAGVGLLAASGEISFNWLENGVNNFSTEAINGNSMSVNNNVVVVDGTTWGISTGQYGSVVNNTIYGGGGSGAGIYVPSAQGAHLVANNVIEGFSGVGGTGIKFADATSFIRYYRNNSVYNCTVEDATGLEVPTIPPIITDGNEILSASPFTDASGGDFSPVNTGSVKEGSWPPSWINS